MGTTHFSTVSQIMKTVLALLAIVAIASSERVTYDGYKVLRTQHLNMTTSKALQSLQLEDVFDSWQDPVIGRSADIMASPEMLSELQQILSKNGIHYTVMVEDVEELESQNIKNYVEALNPTPVLGHSIHSYSQLWLWPYGYAYNAYPPNKAEIKKLAEDAADALYQVHGTVFDPINSAELYPAAGASDDWYRGGLGTRYSFTTELRDTGYYGFVLPPEQIIPSGEELFAGMKVVFEKLIQDAGK